MDTRQLWPAKNAVFIQSPRDSHQLSPPKKQYTGLLKWNRGGWIPILCVHISLCDSYWQTKMEILYSTNLKTFKLGVCNGGSPAFACAIWNLNAEACVLIWPGPFSACHLVSLLPAFDVPLCCHHKNNKGRNAPKNIQSCYTWKYLKVIRPPNN